MAMSRTLILILTITNIISSSTSASCNLLSSNAQYIDTESENALLSMCNNKTSSSLTEWESYQCDFLSKRDGWKKCWPQRRMSHCAPGKLKGVFFFYHGFSACGDAYNTIADLLQEECWHTYHIATIGHGWKYCGDSYDGSTEDSPCTAGKYNESELPNTRQPYIDFINKMNAIIEDEVSIIKSCENNANSDFASDALEIAVGGLSFGAPQAAASVVLSGQNCIFTKQVIMSPFFGISYGGLDDILYKCLANTESYSECLPTFFEQMGLFEVSSSANDALTTMIEDTVNYYVNETNLDNSFATFNLLLRSLITWSIEAPEFITKADDLKSVNEALDHVIGWGAKCEMDEDPIADGGLNRGGFCRFSVRKLAAAHSFSQYITQEYVRTHAMDQSVQTLAIMTERDGQTRNSLVNNYIHLFYNYSEDAIENQSDDCMWLISEECQMDSFNGSIDNRCGVPHAWIAEKDNLLIPPYNLYWNQTANEGVIDWVNNRQNSQKNFLVRTQWDGSRDQCLFLDLSKRHDALIADTPSLVTFYFDTEAGDKADRDYILDRIANLTGTPRGILELTAEFLGDENNKTLQVFLSEDGANVLQSLMKHEAVSNISDYGLTNVVVKGEVYEPTEFEKEEVDVKTKECSSGEKTSAGIIGGVVGIVVGVVLVSLILFVLVRCKGWQFGPNDDKRYSLMTSNQQL